MAEALTSYTKAGVAIAGAVVTAYTAASTDGTVTDVEALQVTAAGVTAVAVYLVPNLSVGPARYLKGIVAFLGALLVALPPYLDAGGWSGITPDDLILVGLAGLSAAAVVIFPNLAPQIVAVTAVATPMVRTALAHRRAVPAGPVVDDDGIVTTDQPPGIDDPGPPEGLPEPTPWPDPTVQGVA